MSVSGVITFDPNVVAWRWRVAVWLVVPVTRVLAGQPPGRLRKVMRLLAKGSRPASEQLTARARAAVVAVSIHCSGPQGCLPRSIATALLCRARGQWPVWCVGVRRHPPFGAHAWVEAAGVAVGEEHPAGYYSRLYAVGRAEEADRDRAAVEDVRDVGPGEERLGGVEGS
ncbi:lasso peptide biosynthesis B2 protein [Kribbella sp. NPDC051587]|uniref:lasso peptide biosynthesis B2 protein n=1 Tax=Kribbella sp. NPDC051587 TaxID=3364119 RepID=UPI0037BC6535